MAISDSTLSVDVWNEVRAAIVAQAPYITNSSTSSTTAASINAVYNDKTASKPQIVITPIEHDEGDFKFGSDYGKRFINVTVECFANNTLGADQLIDHVMEAVRGYSFSNIEMVAVSTDYAFNLGNEQKWHSKSVTFSFDRE